MAQDVSTIIRDSATAYGVDPDTLARIAGIESGNDPNAAASGSSARGLFQFTRPTWAQYGNGGDPLDPVANANAGARFLKDNSNAISAGGYEATPGNLYLAHFAGPGGALSVLKADSNTPVSQILGSQVVKANPFLAGMSAGDLIGWANRKMGTSQAASSAAPSASTSAPPVPGSAFGGILNQGNSAPAASGGPGILNNGADATADAFRNELAQLMAGREQQTQPTAPALPALAPLARAAPIAVAMPRGLSRARLLAALNSPIGG